MRETAGVIYISRAWGDGGQGSYPYVDVVDIETLSDGYTTRKSP